MEAGHCPFLNRDDTRCSALLSLQHLRHAFDHCLGAYQACQTYIELLAERRLRRNDSRRQRSLEGQYGKGSPVQVTVARRVHKPVSAVA